MTSQTSQPSPLQAIPSVDQLLKTDVAAGLRAVVGAERLTQIARQVTDEIRSEIQRSGATHDRQQLFDEAVRRLQLFRNRETSAGIRRVINATGVVLHTNLGRAPLSESARTAVANAAGYCTVEYDPETGKRGRRGARVEELLCQITGAEAALVVNNCAAAALLVLTALARDGETVVSRGELVEIGGDFRVPDVMSNSGTRMVEVGTTNRTRLEDYRRAVTDQTRLIMRVHPSNYRVVGFTATPKLEELVALAHELGLPIYEDAGSGVVKDLSEYGLADEPLISESIDADIDVVSFSGDKLLGATQAGLIVGKQEVINNLRKHSMYRALRVDKLSLAALEATLESHRRGASEEIPTLHMLSISAQTLQTRATAFVANLSESSQLKAIVIEGESAIGGGSGPNVHPATSLVAIEHPSVAVEEMERQLRLASPPIIARITEGRLVLDLRTVDPTEELEVLKALKSVE